jgi:coproporphyrinogen III oxidase-like Fe-S oxidoreductase
MHLTRNLAALQVDCADYRAFFDSDPEEDFRAELRVLHEARLVLRDGDRIALTEDGMFFADSVVGTLANHRAATLRANVERSGARHHMG